MAQDKIQMPSGMGGLVRYFDEYKSKIEFKPIVVVIFIAVIVLLELYLHNFMAIG